MLCDPVASTGWRPHMAAMGSVEFVKQRSALVWQLTQLRYFHEQFSINAAGY
jgi:hypothetical protein